MTASGQTEKRASYHVPCACGVGCGDVREADDHELAVCKGLPLEKDRPYIEIVLLRRETGEVVR